MESAPRKIGGEDYVKEHNSMVPYSDSVLYFRIRLRRIR